MADSSIPEESPAQRAARLRRERREAKIKAGGASRLDRITGLSSGRVPSARDDAPSASTSSDSLVPPSPAGATATPTPTPATATAPTAPSFPNTTTSSSSTSANSQSLDPEFIRQQQEQIRALLRARDDAARPGQQLQQQQQQQPHIGRVSETSDDTEMDVLNKLLSGNPNIPGAGIPGLGSDSILGKAASFFAANGAPGFGQNKPEEQQSDPLVEKSRKKWKIVHFLFGLTMIGYFLYMLHSSLDLYITATAPADSPAADSNSGFNEFVQPPSVYPRLIDGDNLRIPPPPTMLNPTLIFLLGELMLTALRGMLSPTGFSMADPMTWVGMLSNIIKDAKFVIFGLGVTSVWWSKEAEEAGKPRLNEGVWSS